MITSTRLFFWSVKHLKHLKTSARAQPYWQPVSTFTFTSARPKLRQGLRHNLLLSYTFVEDRKTFYNKKMSLTQKEEFKRLPSNVKPVNYEVQLKPDLKAFTFEGSESISVEITEETKTILVNSAEIEISDVTYKREGGGEVKGETELNETAETATFTFPEALQVGPGTLNIKFTGCLNDKMKGFYRSKYTAPNGEERFGAVTQFEASDARRAFPCWDEPALKATFDVTLIAPKDRVALSNMPVKSETDDPDNPSLKVVKYERSPIMSTYLLAFIVGEYDYVEDTDADGVLIRVYTPVGKKEQGKFALDVTVKTLPFYKSYFNIAYPLPKMDLIAIADFSAGAMENWGLVTYRETALLVDPENSSAKSKQWIALVVGHEMAHQWFGNLVTMEWWTNLWLNEGFASWIEYLCVDHVYPDFEIWTQFVVQDLGRALELDGLHTSHPIEVPVGSPAEIDEIFDAISYSKGASVIRMLHDYIGDKDFRVGMHDYLTKFAYKNTKTEDLWECLGKASGKPVAKVMSTWTKQMGFPVISVKDKQDGDNRILEMSQEKFNSDGQTRDGESTKWLVPVGISTSTDPSTPVQTVLLDKPSMSVTVPNTAKGTWAKINPGAVGVYRVRYSSEMLDTLIPGIKDKSLPPRDRLALQNDLFALSRAGMMSAVDVMKVAEGYVNEEDYTVWSDLSLNLGVIAQMIQYTDAYDAYRNFAKTLYAPICKKLGWNTKTGEGVLTAMLRDLVLTKMGRYGDPDVVAESKKRFEDHCNGKTVPADLRQSVYVTVLANGDEEIFNKMLKLYDETDLQEEKVRIARLLGGIKDIKLKEKVLQFAMSDKVRSQDTVFVIGGVTGSKEGRDLGWQFVQDNWDVLFERYSGGFLLPRLIKLVIEGFASEEKAQEIEAFFKKNPAPVADRAIQQSLENIRLNANWMKNEAANVSTFLKDRPAA